MLDPEKRRALRELLLAIASRLLFTPLTWLVPRCPRQVVVIGREGGKFLDNAKYFFCWLEKNRPTGAAPAFVSEYPEVCRLLRQSGVERVYGYPGLAATWRLLRAGCIVFDSADVVESGRLGMLAGATLIQIWHGAPLKEIELPLHQRRLSRLSPPKRLVLELFKTVTGRFLRSHLQVSTSAYFTREAFAPCFNSHRIVESGYPRNDVLVDAPDYPADLVRLNTDQEAATHLRQARAEGKRTLLYAPTFRMDRHSPFDQGWIDLQKLSDFAQEKQLLVALKLHPVLQNRRIAADYPGILDIAPSSDVYPLLADIDLLVTDYSSIFFDFLLLDRPIVFYPYDFEAYTRDDRRLLFDYDTMTPGPKAYSAEQLMECIAATLRGDESVWRDARARVRALTFDAPAGGAAARLWAAVQQRGE